MQQTGRLRSSQRTHIRWNNQLRKAGSTQVKGEEEILSDWSHYLIVSLLFVLELFCRDQLDLHRFSIFLGNLIDLILSRIVPIWSYSKGSYHLVSEPAIQRHQRCLKLQIQRVDPLTLTWSMRSRQWRHEDRTKVSQQRIKWTDVSPTPEHATISGVSLLPPWCAGRKEIMDRLNITLSCTPSAEHCPTSQSSNHLQETTLTETTPNQGATSATKKWETPVFWEENPKCWICYTERFYKLNRVNYWDQLEMTMMKLESTTLDWYLWRDDQYPFEGWNNFKIQLEKWFSTTVAHNIFHKFLNIKHHYVSQYQDK